jgi:hypothetical protein
MSTVGHYPTDVSDAPWEALQQSAASRQGALPARPTRGWGDVRWPPQPRGCVSGGTVAK